MHTTFMPRLFLGATLAAAVACGGDDPAPSPGTDTVQDVAVDTTPAEDTLEGDTLPSDVASDDTAVPDDAAADAPDTAPEDTATPDDTTPDDTVPTGSCGPDNRQACLYRAAATYTVDTHEVRDLTYDDILGAERKVHIAIYRPLDAPTPAPVVLLSHGGASGKTNPFNSMEHWASVFAEAGYVAVAIAHEGRDETSYRALCDALETNPDHFCTVKLSWDRPHDVQRVLTYLDERNATGQFAGLLDMERIAHVGHSAGATAALMSAGVTRNFKCALAFGNVDPDQDCQVADLVSLAVDRVDVAIAMSPQGPGSEGFMAESYGAVDKPVLMATGANDGDPGEPENRASLFPLLPEGDKFRLFIDDQGAKHTLFEGSLDACTPIAGRDKCVAMRASIFATGLAFMDAHLRGDAAAAAWLASDDLETAGGGLFSFDRR